MMVTSKTRRLIVLAARRFAVYYYDGGSEPNAIHHLIGRRGERLCFRRNV